MLLRSVVQLRSIPVVASGSRFFSQSSTVWAKKPLQRAGATARADARKLRLQKMAERRLEARKLPSTNPLYMDIPTAMRYLRAVEVGRAPLETTLTLQMKIVNEQGAKPVAGSVTLPRPIQEARILVFAETEERQEQLLAAGAKVAGGLDLVEKIAKNEIALNFNQCFATPEMSRHLAPIARILGPKGLMPNVKRGTVTKDIELKMLESLGSLSFRQRTQILSLPVGRCHFTDEEIIKNIMAISNEVKLSAVKVSSKKPALVGQTVLSSPRGPGIVIDF